MNPLPAVWIKKDDVAPRKLVIRGDKKSSPGERSPTDSVDDASYEATEELDVSKRVDMSAKGYEMMVLSNFLDLKYPWGVPLLKLPSNTVPSGFRLTTGPSKG